MLDVHNGAEGQESNRRPLALQAGVQTTYTTSAKSGTP